MDTLFVLTHVPNPRMNKRILALKRLGKVSVACVRRKNQDVYEPILDDVPHNILEMELHSANQPLRRMLAFFRFFAHVFKAARASKPGLLYVASVDSLMIARLYQLFHKKAKIVLEVADVREVFLREGGIRRALLRFVEKRLYRHVDLLVLTSDQFYTQYYHRFFPVEKTVVMHNLPNLSFFSNYRKKKEGPFTVGFIGGLRYLNQMKMLVDAAQQAQVHVLFAGAGGQQGDLEAIQVYCQGKDNITFTGKYQYERDIAKLYGMVDCVYAVYDADNPNVRIALPNKLYEAAFCELPIIVAKNTYLSELVEKYGLGLSVNHKDSEELVAVLNKLKDNSVHIDVTGAGKGLRFLSEIQSQDLSTAIRKVLE